ncbi:MAG TPA: dephospho-CoA kinase [Hellea balneolensis]|uniref:Dephospho-CoA kinase n=1 Tax=Hellea balneolensis TaxID=287478 RepID=A0A7C5M077_9PROT|nr:dephospho-CoA kinase [Hellea balneolensis]
MITIGLTGSIGMGKSTTTQMFKDLGCAVFDADAAVHALYAKGGKAVPIIGATFPDAIVNGAVDREKLAAHLRADPLHIGVLESFIHPLVAEMRKVVVEQAVRSGKKIIVFDIPLLFETGGDARVDKTVVVSAPAHIQEKRVLARPNMSTEKFAMIKSRQMPDIEKRKQTDYIVHTDKGLDFARAQVRDIIKDILAKQNV